MNSAKQNRIKALLQLGTEIVKLDAETACRLMMLFFDAMEAAKVEDEPAAILGQVLPLDGLSTASEQTQLAILAEIQKLTALMEAKQKDLTSGMKIAPLGRSAFRLRP